MILLVNLEGSATQACPAVRRMCIATLMGSPHTPHTCPTFRTGPATLSSVQAAWLKIDSVRHLRGGPSMSSNYVSQGYCSVALVKS